MVAAKKEIAPKMKESATNNTVLPYSLFLSWPAANPANAAAKAAINIVSNPSNP